MSNPAIKVTVRNGTVTVRFPVKLLRAGSAGRQRQVRDGKRALRAARGMWKRRKIDPLGYQRAARAEWN